MINLLRKEYFWYKDDGSEYIKKLSSKVANAYEDEKRDIINFFIVEIRTDQNKMGHLSLDIIEELKLKEVAPLICNIFKDVSAEKDFEWKWHTITTLMKLGYDQPKEVYNNYVIDYLINDKWHRGFLLLVLYGNVEKENSIVLLADYYHKNLSGGNEQMKTYLENSANLLISHFYKQDFDHILRLINMLYGINKEEGKWLQKTIMNCIDDPVWMEQWNYDKELINKQLILVASAIE